jgi:exosome complex RNA-binding protein Rrp4
MRLSVSNNLWAMVAVGVSIIVNIAGLAWIQGKNEQRMTNVEAAIGELKAKSEKDGEQDVKIAVIGAQLATISTGVGEIKSKLEARP